jgi:two-component system response regulator
METHLTRILVIEDNQDDEALLLRMLKRARLDSHVDVVRDGKQALDHLTHREARIESLMAVFLDLNIPSINGLQLLALIREDDRLRHLPVVVMTSSNSPQDLLECRKLGVMSYIQKPLTLATFTKAIADILHLPNGTKRSLEQVGLVE